MTTHATCVLLLQVPVYKTVIATDVAVKDRNELVYSTVVKIQTISLTSTVLETTTEILTSVSVGKVLLLSSCEKCIWYYPSLWMIKYEIPVHE